MYLRYHLHVYFLKKQMHDFNWITSSSRYNNYHCLETRYAHTYLHKVSIIIQSNKIRCSDLTSHIFYYPDDTVSLQSRSGNIVRRLQLQANEDTVRYFKSTDGGATWPLCEQLVKIASPYYSGIITFTQSTVGAWCADTAHPLVFAAGGIYIGVFKIATGSRNTSHYMDAHLQDFAGNAPLWESEGVLPLSLPAGGVAYRTLSLPFIYVAPASGITLYAGFCQSDSISEVTYEVSWIRMI